MDGQDNSTRSIRDIIHKERSKEKPKTKGLKALDQRPQAKGLKEGSTVQSQMPMSNEQQTKGEQLSKYRLEKLRKNSEIDNYLYGLLNENLINIEYWSFHAKAVHTLGINFCNMLAINARNGSKPQQLYAFKIKGAMQVHYKRLFDQEG